MCGHVSTSRGRFRAAPTDRDSANRCLQMALLREGCGGCKGSFLSDPSKSRQRVSCVSSLSEAFGCAGGGGRGACPAAVVVLQLGVSQDTPECPLSPCKSHCPPAHAHLGPAAGTPVTARARALNRRLLIPQLCPARSQGWGRGTTGKVQAPGAPPAGQPPGADPVLAGNRCESLGWVRTGRPVLGALARQMPNCQARVTFL